MGGNTNSGQLDGAAAPTGGAAAAPVDLAAVFDALPGIDLVLAPDAPRYTMLAATEGRLRVTMTTRAGTLGRPLFEVFPDANPDNPDATGVGNLRASLDTVLRTRAPHRMAVQRYDVQRPDGTWEARYWDPLNVPVLGPDGAVRYILHRVEDVTESVRLVAEGDRLRGAVAGSEQARATAEAARDEIAAANGQLQDQALELELANQQLQEQAAELEAQAEELQATAAQLEERTKEAERAQQVAEAERARAAGVLEAMSDAYFALDRDFRIVAANAAMERSTGLTRDALLGRVFWDVFPATVGTAYERHYRAAATAGATAHFTDAYDDGRLALVSEADVHPVAGGGVAVFWRDVTARVRAEAALRESEALERQLFALSPIPKWVYDAETLAFLDVNDAAVRHYGYTREEFLAMSIRDIRPPAEVPRMLAVAQAPHPTGGSHGIFHHRTRSGEIIEVEVFLRDVQYEGRRAVIAVVQDVTERRRAEAALLEASRAAAAARDAAEAANAAKGLFLSTMSHELRTPLNAIGGYTELLTLGLRGPLTEAQRQDLERVRLANQHLMSLVTDVLNFARIDAGQVDYRLADVELAPVVADLEPLVGPQLAAKGLAFDHDACAADTPGRPHRVRADPEKLRQVLLNLLTNAIKFTDAGGRVTLACETDAGGGVTRVRVTDTGRGIPADQLERIFEPFVQVDRHRTHESQQGVGLGLAISRDLARGMGGDLTAESTPGIGSTFTLTLPSAP